MDPHADHSLTLRAKGVYAVIAQLDPEVGASVETIAAQSRDGAEVTRAAIRELKTKGYIRLQRTRGSGGLLDGIRYLLVTPSMVAPADPVLLASRSNRHGTVGWTYAISAADQVHVKLGRTENLRRRLHNHNTSSPVELFTIWSQQGGAGLEVHLHQHFATRRIRREWFDFTGLDAVRSITEAAASFGGPR